ncbi:cyclic-phosphate processing receiver domain-containing protein [Singulisphaera sp. PoT]|uniref:cyclic-phosphate processing receiver domain-containing protein n=1 Tax=Singulisphaera sp. PoT TaxID=3411797 RepID=UPI003BF5C716
MRVWLDDERPMPDGYDVLVRTAPEAIDLIRSGQVTKISLNHDLGPPEAGTGYDVAKAIAEMAYHGRFPEISFRVHIANPVGRKNIVDCLQNAKRFWWERAKESAES